MPYKLLSVLFLSCLTWSFAIAAPLQAQNVQENKDAGDPTDHELNIELRLALCVQDWDRSVRVLNKMEKIFPQYAVRLNAYRANITVFRNSDADVPDWPPAEYCGGTPEEDKAN
jgi:hypothetical protein